MVIPASNPAPSIFELQVPSPAMSISCALMDTSAGGFPPARTNRHLPTRSSVRTPCAPGSEGFLPELHPQTVKALQPASSHQLPLLIIHPRAAEPLALPQLSVQPAAAC